MEKYLIECDYELHKDFVQNNIRNLGSDDPDVILISEDGREVTTNKIFLSLFTPIFNNICSDPRQKTANINVPFPYETLTLLLQFLITGYVDSQDEHQLNLMVEMMNCLKINTEEININQMFPRAGTIPKPTEARTEELEEFLFDEEVFVLEEDEQQELGDYEKVEQNEFYSTPKMKPSKKRKGSIKKEKKENIDPVKVKTEHDVVLNKELPELDIPTKKSAQKKKQKSKGPVTLKEEAFDGLGEDSLGEEKNSTVCKICKKRFKNRIGLKQHRVTHTKEKTYECSECGKKFGTPGILYNHGFVHNPPHHCDICTAKFAQKSGLQSHLKNFHGSS